MWGAIGIAIKGLGLSGIENNFIMTLDTFPIQGNNARHLAT